MDIFQLSSAFPSAPEDDKALDTIAVAGARGERLAVVSDQQCTRKAANLS